MTIDADSTTILTNLQKQLKANPSISYEAFENYLKGKDYLNSDPLKEKKVDLAGIDNLAILKKLQARAKDENAQQKIENCLSENNVRLGSFQAYYSSPDNNCFFNAFSLLLTGTEDLATDLRWAISRELLLHLEEYQSSGLITGWEQKGDIAAKNLLVDWVASDQGWAGGTTEYLILAKILGRPIATFNLRTNKIIYHEPEKEALRRENPSPFWTAFVNRNHHVPVLAIDKEEEKKLIKKMKEDMIDERNLIINELADYTVSDANNFYEIAEKEKGNEIYTRLREIFGAGNYADLVNFAFRLAQLTTDCPGLIFSAAMNEDWISIKKAALILKLASLSEEKYQCHTQKKEALSMLENSHFTCNTTAHLLNTFFIKNDKAVYKIKTGEEIEEHYNKEVRETSIRFLAKLDELKNHRELVSTLPDEELKKKFTGRFSVILDQWKENFEEFLTLQKEIKGTKEKTREEKGKIASRLQAVDSRLTKNWKVDIDGNEARDNRVEIKKSLQWIRDSVTNRSVIKFKGGSDENKKSELLKEPRWQELYSRYGCEKEKHEQEEEQWRLNKILFYRKVWEDYLLFLPAENSWEKDFDHRGQKLVKDLREERFNISDIEGKIINLATPLSAHLARFLASFLGEFGYPLDSPAVKLVAEKIQAENKQLFGVLGEENLVRQLVSNAWQTIHFRTRTRIPAYQWTFFSSEDNWIRHSWLEIKDSGNQAEEISLDTNPPFVAYSPFFFQFQEENDEVAVPLVSGQARSLQSTPTPISNETKVAKHCHSVNSNLKEKLAKAEEEKWLGYQAEIKSYLRLFTDYKEELEEIKRLYKKEFGEKELEWKLSWGGEKYDLLTGDFQARWKEFEQSSEISDKVSRGQSLAGEITKTGANDTKSENSVENVKKKLDKLPDGLENITWRTKFRISEENMVAGRKLAQDYGLNCDFTNLDESKKTSLLRRLLQRKVMTELLRYDPLDFPSAGKKEENQLIQKTSQLINRISAKDPITTEPWRLQLAQKIYGPMSEKLYQPESLEKEAEEIFTDLESYQTIKEESDRKGGKKRLASLISQTWRFFYLWAKTLSLNWDFHDWKLAKDAEELIEVREIEIADSEAEKIREKEVDLDTPLLCYFPAVFYSLSEKPFHTAQMKLALGYTLDKSKRTPLVNDNASDASDQATTTSASDTSAFSLLNIILPIIAIMAIIGILVALPEEAEKPKKAIKRKSSKRKKPKTPVKKLKK